MLASEHSLYAPAVAEQIRRSILGRRTAEPPAPPPDTSSPRRCAAQAVSALWPAGSITGPVTVDAPRPDERLFPLWQKRPPQQRLQVAFKLQRIDAGVRPSVPSSYPVEAHKSSAPTFPYIKARVNKRNCRCLLDSGADVCLLPRPPFVPESHLIPSNEKLRAANGMEIDIEGRVTLPVTIQGQTVFTEFLVSANMDDIILGKNWLATKSVTWNLRDNTNLWEKAVQLIGSRHDSPRCQRCRISEDTVIPSEAVLPTTVVYKHTRTPFGVEQCSTVPAEPVRGLRITRTLIPNDVPVAAVRVCNTTRCPIHLYKEQAVATLQKVDTLPSMDPSVDAPDTASDQRRQMATRIDPSVPAEHQAKLKQLLDEYSDVFSYREYYFGSTGAQD